MLLKLRPIVADNHFKPSLTFVHKPMVTLLELIMVFHFKGGSYPDLRFRIDQK
jgi:hypothetical protein